MTSEEIVLERDGPVRWVIFNRPAARNALTSSMYDAVATACDDTQHDESIRAVVFYGAGGEAFAAGSEIAQLRGVRSADDAVAYEARGDRVMTAIEGVRVPTIAAIAGWCIGGGASIAASCDLRIASPSARYGFPIARTLGNCVSPLNYARLTTLLGLARVKDLIMTARTMDAEELLVAGLLTEIAPDEASLRPRAQQLAERVAGYAPLTLYATKEALRRIRERLAPSPFENDLIELCYTSEDFHEGVDAFLSHRKPVWRGR